ncbi:MAG: hypothetical protein J0L93_11460 [Deltaproteobacteria bacterium]|nr:hypothetical protein [Deltaproteobacteria bacterium]
MIKKFSGFLIFALNISLNNVFASQEAATKFEYLSNLTSPLKKTEQDCYKRRRDLACKNGEAFQELIERVEAEHFPKRVSIYLSGCQESSLIFAKTYDWIGASTLIHEYLHLLGEASYQLRYFGLKSGPKINEKVRQHWKKDGYSYASIQNGKLTFSTIPYVGDLPKNSTLKPIIAPHLPFLKKQEYLEESGTPIGFGLKDLYILLDEWNAYQTEVEFNLEDVRKNSCPSNISYVDLGNSAVEFSIFVYLYLKNLDSIDSKIYQQLRTKKEVWSFIVNLSNRTHSVIDALTASKCLIKEDRWIHLLRVYKEQFKEFKPYR